jgi:DNA-binding NarL/FixJ family response regulator
MNGVEAAKRIKFTSPDSIILVLSSYDYEQYVKAMLRAGAKGYILKSASGRELVEAIRLACAGGSPFSEAIARQIVESLSKNESPLPPRKSSIEELSEREFEVLRLLAKGTKNTQIAELLEISINTVESHVKRLCGKLKVNTRGEAVVAARQRGLLEIDEVSL